MIDWPNAPDYQTALQHPAHAFRDARLQRRTVETRPNSPMPLPRSGSNALVYRMTGPGGDVVAARVFLHPDEPREARYRAIRDHLKARRPACLVGFDYDPQGVQVHGKGWFPVLTMDWVSGVNLRDWVADRVARQDADGLRQMAARWMRLVEELGAGRIAHGDLAHDNVLVVNDEPVLVDYDGMCVPALVDQPTREFGKPAYQLPLRAAAVEPKLSLDLDRFSAWIILLSLRGLAAAPRLWAEYVEGKHDNLLFDESDLVTPFGAPIWYELKQSPDQEVRGWAERLERLVPDGSSDEVPVFDFDPFRPLRAALAESPRDWERIDRLAHAAAGCGRPMPGDLAQASDEASRRVRCREDVVQALAIGPRAVAKAFTTAHLLANWSAAAALAERAKQAIALIPHLDEMERLAAAPGDGRQLAQLWSRYRAALQSKPEAAAFAAIADRWTARVQACDAFLAAVRDTVAERDVAAAWQRLEQAGGHPDADTHAERGRHAAARAGCLDALRAIPTDDSDENDRRWVQAWDEALLGDCPEAAPLRARHDLARSRLRLLRDVLLAIQQADQGTGIEEQVVQAARRLPQGYRCRAAPRVREARARVEAYRELQEELQGPAPSDRVIADAWDRMGPHREAVVDPAMAQRCELAVRRRECLDTLKALSTRLSADEQDRLWLEHWDEGLLDGCHDADPLRARYQLAAGRHSAWQELQRCLAAHDLDHIDELAAHPLLPGYAPFEQRRNEIRGLAASAELRRRLRRLLADRLVGFSADDLRFLRESPDLVGDDRPAVEAALQQWLDVHARPEAIGPGWECDPYDGQLKARWNWPRQDIVVRYLVAADPQRYFHGPEEAPDALSSFDAASQRRNRGGYSLLPPAGAELLCVTVWPVIDLGWSCVVGRPLFLGPVPARGKR